MNEPTPPPGRPMSWIDRQIADAEARGAFDDLPSKGKPLDLSDSDELWFVKKLMKREGLHYLPPALALRKEIETTVAAIREMSDEDDVRRAIDALNDQIREAIRRPQSGPPHGLATYDADRFVARWRADRG